MKNVERKLIVVGCCVLLLSIGLSVLATRTITDSSDTVLSSITTSAGGVYAATAANIQVALNSKGNNSGWISLATTTYTITSSINVWNNTIIYGNGATLRLGTAANCIVINLNFKTAGGSPNDGRHDIIIENLRIDGNNGSQTWSQYYGGIGMAGGCNNITIRNVKINNTCSNGIFQYNIAGQTKSGKNIVIDNCEVRDIGRHVGDFPGGVYISGQYCKVINSHFINTWACGVIFQSYTYKTMCKYNIVQDCTFTGYMSTGIWFEGMQGNNNTAIGNHIFNINSSAYVVSESFFSRGIVCGQNDSKIIGNTIENCTDFGIYVTGLRILINSNTIYNILGGKPHSYAGSGIYMITPSNNISITGNIFTNCANYSIITKSKCLISDNIIQGSIRGIHIMTSSNNITITNNRIIGQSSRGISGDSIICCQLIGNRVKATTIGLCLTGTCKYNQVVCNNGIGSGSPFDMTTSATSNMTLNQGTITWS